MNKSLVVVGMNSRPLAHSAVRAGLDVVAIDTFGFLDILAGARCLSLAYDLGGLFPADPVSWHARLAQAARLQRADSLAYSGGFENFPDLVAAMSVDCELLGNSPDSLRAVRDPYRLQEVVASVGLLTPQILPPGTQPDPSLRWLRKGVRSASGFGVEPWDSLVPNDPAYIVQRWVEGVPHSASFIANGHHAQVFAVTRQLSGDAAFGARGFAYVGNLLIPDPDVDLLASLNRLATALTRAFGLVGLNGIDFILDNAKLTILEVNPRYSASMELVAASQSAPYSNGMRPGAASSHCRYFQSIMTRRCLGRPAFMRGVMALFRTRPVGWPKVGATCRTRAKRSAPVSRFAPSQPSVLTNRGVMPSSWLRLTNY